MKDKFTIRGVFILKIFRNGVLVERYEDDNLVVATGRNAVARLVGGTVANNSVTTIGVGTNGTAPTLANTALTDSFTKAIIGVTYPATGEAHIAWAIAESEANGKAIREFGLITQGGALFARKTRELITKTSDLRLEGTWKLIF